MITEPIDKSQQSFNTKVRPATLQEFGIWNLPFPGGPFQKVTNVLSSAELNDYGRPGKFPCNGRNSHSRPAIRAQRYFAPRTATGFSVAYG